MYAPSIVHFAELAREKADARQRAPGGFFVAAMMAGAYIGIAMILALSAAAGLEPGLRPPVMGAVFGVGLILTMFSGGELFTGCVMYAGFGLARGRVTLAEASGMLVMVWLGNLAGAMILSQLFAWAGGGVVFAAKGAFLQAYAAHKIDAAPVALLARAILCNWLVCLAIWTAARVEGDAAKCLVLAWTLMAFVAPGFEHSVANMTALTLALIAPDSQASLAGVVQNLVLVTLGNVLGAAVLVVGGFLAAAKTDSEGPARHDAGHLPTTLRTTAPLASEGRR